MASYYYLISSLPEIKSIDHKMKYDIYALTESIISTLSKKDLEAFNYLLYENDNKNLVRHIALSKGLFCQYKDFLKPSIFDEETIAKITNASNVPLYMAKFVEYNKNREWESVKQIENTLTFYYYEEMINSKNDFLKKYALYLRDLKNILAALNGRSLGFSSDAISSELIGDYPLIAALSKSTSSDFGLGREIPYVNSIVEAFSESDTADPYNIENLEASLVIDYLYSLTSIKSFCFENVFTYYINLIYASKFSERNEEEGKECVHLLINSVKEEMYKSD